MSRPISARRNIGVRSGIAENQEGDILSTTPVEADWLERLFSRLKENLDYKLQKQQELEERLEQVRSQIARKETAAEKEALDRRFGAIKVQLQTFVTKFRKIFRILFQLIL